VRRRWRPAVIVANARRVLALAGCGNAGFLWAASTTTCRAHRGAFSLFADVLTTGSYPVVIESVSLPRGGPVLARPVRHATEEMGGSIQIPPPVWRVLAAGVMNGAPEPALLWRA
jgi:hypothetical protein